MSYDIQIWSAEKPDLASALPNASRWNTNSDCWALERKQWQIVCGPPDLVLPEDIPEAAAANLPGISYLTELVLEPIDAPKSARKELMRTASAVAKASHGLVLDRQTDMLTTPRGVKRFVPTAREERFAVIELGWWFLSDTLFAREGMTRLLDICSTHLPEVLPRRYGRYEPPQYQLAQTSREHLTDFLLENVDQSPVLYPSRPIVGLTLACTRERQHPRLGFRCNRLSMEVEASVICQPGWQEGLRHFWLAVSDHLDPFFAEARTLHGYLRMGATFGSDIETDVHPIRSWFWRGIPQSLGHAVALGTPYVELWPDARKGGQTHGNLIVLDAGDWIDGNHLAVKAPDSICQAWTPQYTRVDSTGWSVNWVNEYPQVWPFDSE